MTKRLRRAGGRVFDPMKEMIKRQIEMGELGQGEAIMAERKLAEAFSISRESVRRGLRELIEEGFLKVVPAKGVFVDYQGPRRHGGQGTSTLGYVFWGAPASVLHNPFFEGLVRGVEQELRNQGFHLMVASDPSGGTARLPRMVKDKKVDGVLLEGAPIETYRHIEQFVPVVGISNYILINGAEAQHTGDMVCPDNQRAIVSLFACLYEMGHRKVGFITPPLDHSSFLERFEGYQLAHYRYGLPLHREYIINTPGNPDPESVMPILQRADRPTAIMCANDFTALVLLRAARKAAIAVPEELSVTGFDDLDQAAGAKPPLTTVRVSTVEMGRLAVRRLIEKIERRDPDEVQIHIQGELVLRGSCAPPATG